MASKPIRTTSCAARGLVLQVGSHQVMSDTRFLTACPSIRDSTSTDGRPAEG
jgi:hypothetical protein